MWQSLPDFGSAILYAVLVSAAYTFAVAIAAGRGRPRLLQAARLGAYATSGTVLLGVLLLAYAFLTHDFRLSYVARYSDRSMPTSYLFTALWGGQDGSLLWWSLLLSLYIAACVRWLKGRYRELQPYIIATLMVIVSFFAILMIFAANPFATSIAGGRPDGEGLNPLLQSYWMIIHPPALYTGFVGCAVPFAFAVAAMVTGRLDNEWIVAVRKWMLFAFLFLSIGNVLGMMWAYEELGWGGYWAWDPVENAACLPWFTAAAYLHSTMIQERRNMLKVWNVFLICLTFWLTIFGTFLTRSGLIASVHSFAQSNIGIFFVYFMILVAAACLGMIVWRLPLLKGRANIEAVASREAMFVVNNWALLGAMTFIAVATVFPKISEWLWNESVTVGPPFFNRWMAPIGLLIFMLMGLAPLFGWRKTSSVSLRKAFMYPVGALVVTVVLHVTLGSRLGYPAIVPTDAFYPGILGVILQKIGSATPAITIGLAGFNVAVIIQEFVRGVSARRSSARKRNESESVPTALLRLIEKNRRRYGGYIVHLGIISMFIGFVGSAWNIHRETSLVPGQTYQLGEYELVYRGSRMCPGNSACSPEEQSDVNKRMIFADLDVSRNGEALGRVSPAKFIYHRQPQSPTTEVAMLHSLRADLYAVVGTVDPSTKRATFQLHINALVMWIWIGVVVLISGTLISLWPELSLGRIAVWQAVRATATASAMVALSIWVAMGPSMAYAAPKAARSPASAVPTPKAGDIRSLFASKHTAPVAGALGAGVLIGAVHGRRRKSNRAKPRSS
jgi:cytochrome c-type biogenesis protein CcmF